MFGKGNKGEKSVSIAKATDVEADVKTDDLGPFPQEVDSNPSQSRTQERALRAVSIVAIVSGMMNIALIMLLIMLFPLQKVFPYLVTFKSQDNQVVTIEPMEVGAPGMLYATEDSVRDYITQRHSFTPIEAVMKAQWGPGSRLAARTTAELYQKFQDPARAETERMMTAGYSRTVDINSVQRIASDTWQINFTTVDTLPTAGGTMTPPGLPLPQNPDGQSFAAAQAAAQQTPVPSVSKQTWIATMRVAYSPQTVTYDKRLLNPLGFTVTDYSVSRRD